METAGCLLAFAASGGELTRKEIKTDFGEPIKDLCVYTYTPEKYFLSSSNFPEEEGYDTKNDVLVVLTTIPPDKS